MNKERVLRMITKEMIEAGIRAIQDKRKEMYDNVGDSLGDSNFTKRIMRNDIALSLAKAALEAAEAVRPSGWQPIETAPRDGTEIIITNGYEVYTAKYYKGIVLNDKPWFAKSADGELFNDGYDHENAPIYMYRPTHWQPLPELPEEITNE